MYENGRGVAQSYSQAVDWYRKAAEQGYAYGQHRLGDMYENGRGVAQNLVLAHVFYNLAAVDDGTSVSDRDAIALKLTSAQLSEAQELASKWVKGQPLPTLSKTYPRASKKRK